MPFYFIVIDEVVLVGSNKQFKCMQIWNLHFHLIYLTELLHFNHNNLGLSDDTSDAENEKTK